MTYIETKKKKSKSRKQKAEPVDKKMKTKSDMEQNDKPNVNINEKKQSTEATDSRLRNMKLRFVSCEDGPKIPTWFNFAILSNMERAILEQIIDEDDIVTSYESPN